MTIKDIVAKFLAENGYDGLYSPDLECGCNGDDLAPCGECICECLPGVQVPMTYDGKPIMGIGPREEQER